MKNIKVSIIVPVYNTEKYLDKCLSSLVNQELKDVEIIIVNDGSTDNSAKIIESYLKKYANIKSFFQENKGQSAARNLGISKSSGEYIGFVDSDDFVKKDMFLKMYECALANESDIVVCNTIIVNDKKKFELKSNLNYSTDVVRNYIISYPMPPIRLIKRELFKIYKFTEKINYEDLCLMPTFALLTNKITFLDEALYYYVQRKNSIMNSDFTEKQLDIFKALNGITEKYIENNLYDNYKDEIEYLYITHLLRSTSLRFINYDNYQELLSKINNLFRNEFPYWSKNKYYKKSSIKVKIICLLSFNKHYKLLKLLKIFSNT